MLEHVVPIDKNVWEKLEGVALLEEECHRPGL